MNDESITDYDKRLFVMALSILFFGVFLVINLVIEHTYISALSFMGGFLSGMACMFSITGIRVTNK